MSLHLLSPSGSAAAAPSRREFMCVPLAVFQVLRTQDVDLYCLPDGATTPTLYRSSKIAITDEDIASLKDRGHRALYVATAEYDALDRNLKAALDDILDDESLGVEARMAVLQTAVAVEVDVAFHMIKCDRAVDVAHRVAGQIAKLLDGDSLVPRKLFHMVQHDFYTFTHVTNVASFATLLADQLGMSTPDNREKITVGALLHDIGKRFIPTSVLCKRGKPTEDEWNLIKAHPQRGYEDLCDRTDLDVGQLMMVYSHHERLDGGGYPVGLVEEDIHPWAKMLAVVDVFDALTSARPYRLPMKIADALEYLERHAGEQFDREMVRCWASAMRQQ
jgi:HD-GYP domain-containing protein (c-di-GMP phosphodiesterase class II)